MRHGEEAATLATSSAKPILGHPIRFLYCFTMSRGLRQRTTRQLHTHWVTGLATEARSRQMKMTPSIERLSGFHVHIWRVGETDMGAGA